MTRSTLCEFRIPVEMKGRKIKSLTMREKLDVLVKQQALTCKNMQREQTVDDTRGGGKINYKCA